MIQNELVKERMHAGAETKLGKPEVFRGEGFVCVGLVLVLLVLLGGGGEVGRWCLCVLFFSYFLSTTPEKTEIEYYISNSEDA